MEEMWLCSGRTLFSNIVLGRLDPQTGGVLILFRISLDSTGIKKAGRSSSALETAELVQQEGICLAHAYSDSVFRAL